MPTDYNKTCYEYILIINSRMKPCVRQRAEFSYVQVTVCRDFQNYITTFVCYNIRI